MKRVFVSGGSGYIAMYCIKILISKGYYVVTSVIDKSKIDVIKNALINHGVSCDNIDFKILNLLNDEGWDCLLYTSPSPRDRTRSRMPSSA